jgi:hypothetical protein
MYSIVWYGMVWYGMVWYGMVWYGMVWHGMIWHGMIWYGMVWYGRDQNLPREEQFEMIPGMILSSSTTIKGRFGSEALGLSPTIFFEY